MSVSTNTLKLEVALFVCAGEGVREWESELVRERARAREREREREKERERLRARVCGSIEREREREAACTGVWVYRERKRERGCVHGCVSLYVAAPFLWPKEDPSFFVSAPATSSCSRKQKQNPFQKRLACSALWKRDEKWEVDKRAAGACRCRLWRFILAP